MDPEASKASSPTLRSQLGPASSRLERQARGGVAGAGLGGLGALEGHPAK